MKLDVKKLLLTGTAIVAVSALAAPAVAQTVDINGANQAVAADPNDDPAILFTTDHIATINDGVDVTGTGDNAVNAGTANFGTLTFSGDSTVTGDVGILNGNEIKVINAGVTGKAVTINGDVAATTVNLTADGTLTINGTTTATDIDFADDGVITLNGDFTVTGTIDNSSGGANAGTLNLAGSGSVAGAVGASDTLKAIVIGADTKDANVVFGGDVSTTGGIQVGENGGTHTESNTVTFGSTAADTAITGAIAGGHADQTNTVNVVGGKVVTFATEMGDHIDTLSVAANTTLKTVSAEAGAVTLGAGSTLQSNGNNANWTGAINGAGTLDINDNVTHTGSIGGTTALTAITVANNKTLTIAGGDDRTVAAGSILLEDAGAGATLAFGDPTAGKTITINAPITTGTDGEGTVSFAAGEGTVNINGDVGTGGATGKAVKALTLADNAGVMTVNTSNNLYVDTITLGAADTLNLLGSNQTVSGVLNGSTSKGIVNVGSASANANVTFGSAIGGTTLNAFKVFTGSTANVSNSLNTNNGDIVVDGTLKIDATDNVVSVGAGGTGDIDLNGTVEITGTDAAKGQNVTIGANTDLTIDGVFSTNIGAAGKTTTIGGVNASTIGGSTDTTITAGNQIVLSTATTFGVAGKTVTLNIAASDTFDVDANAVIDANGQNVTITPDSVLKVGVAQGSSAVVDGATITVIGGAGGGGTDFTTALGDDRIVLQDSAFINLEDDTSTATVLKVKATYNSANDVLTSQSAVDGANILINTTPVVTDTQLVAARNNLLTAPTAAEANTIAESIVPTVDGGHVVAAQTITTTSFGLANDRLAALRTGETGMAAGNGMQGHRFWGQVFGSTATQDRRDGVAGYDADSYGFSVGLDTETLSNNGILGVAFTYGDTEVDSNNGFGTNSEIDTYQVSLYGDYDLDQTTFINGMLAYAWSDVDTTRNNVGGTGLTAAGDFDAHQFTAQAAVGRDYHQDSMTVTPNLLAHWSHYSADGYTETGAGGLNMNVDQDDLNIFELGIGVAAAWQYETASGIDVVPTLHAGYRYDFIGDEIETTNRFVGGGAAFKTNGADPAQHKFNVGAGLNLYTTDNWEISANYDFEYKSDYDAHSGFLRAGVKF